MTYRSWARFSQVCPNFWQILYMYADIDLSVSPQQDRRLIQLTVPPIQLTGYLLFAAHSYSLLIHPPPVSSVSFFPPFTSLHVHLFTSCLSSFHHMTLYLFQSSSALPCLMLLTGQSHESNHYGHTNKQITLQMVIDVHINQLRLLNKKVFKLTCQDILHLKVSCSVYALPLKVMVKVTLHSVDEIRQVGTIIWFRNRFLIITKLSLDSTHNNSANCKPGTSLTQWKLILHYCREISPHVISLRHQFILLIYCVSPVLCVFCCNLLHCMYNVSWNKGLNLKWSQFQNRIPLLCPNKLQV